MKRTKKSPLPPVVVPLPWPLPVIEPLVAWAGCESRNLSGGGIASEPRLPSHGAKGYLSCPDAPPPDERRAA